MGFLGFYLPGFDFLKLCHIAFVVLVIEINSIAMVGCCVMSGETILTMSAVVALLLVFTRLRAVKKRKARARRAFALKNAPRLFRAVCLDVSECATRPPKF